jgi:iron complex transport system substrate-binding protein
MTLTPRKLWRALALLPVVLAIWVCAVEMLDGSWRPPARQETGNPATRTLADQQGDPVALPARVERVATPGISLASLIVVMSEGRKLAAVAPEVRDNPWLRHVFPQVAALPTPFARPAGVSLEPLLASRPDLVVLWSGNAPIAQRLKDAGMAVLTVSYADPVEMKAAVRLLGAAMGPAESARAEAFIRYYEDNLARVARGLSGLAPATRPRVYYASIDALRTEGRHSMVDAWIQAAGGRNVAAEAGITGDAQVGLEEVLRWDPEIIVTLDARQREHILADPRWQTVRAVRNGRVVVNPSGINAWCTRAAETALQVLWAAKLFHPERFAELSIAAETRQFYQRFYGHTLDDDDLAQVLLGQPPSSPVAPAADRRTP